MQIKIDGEPDLPGHHLGLAGFRLSCMEMYNWGTFDHDVWRIDPMGMNSLLTGDIGSGKSTLVDAITTLLVPHHRIIFNKAAGASARERSLYSYIRGEYKNIKYDYEHTGKPVALRDQNSCTIILGYFYNQGFNQGVTLAQVFWIKDSNPNPERFFIISESKLSIATDFTDFGDNILDLKKRLKKQPHVQVMDLFKTYSSKFRRLLGIKDPQALDLFHQTVSMKSVGNLTRFIRLHMLDRTNVEDRIRDIRKNFDNLNIAHGAVIKAKEQIRSLAPISENGQKYRASEARQEELHQCRKGLNAYFALIQITLLKQRIDLLQQEIKKCQHHIQIIERELLDLRQQHSALQIDIDDNGGRRIRDIVKEMQFLETERDFKKQREYEYLAVAKELGFSSATKSLDMFMDNHKKAGSLLLREEKNLLSIQDNQVTTKIEIQDFEDKVNEIRKELLSLKSRKNNISLKNLELRKQMAQGLNLDEEEMPFIGELIRVDENHLQWEGALERLLRSWGLSILVPEGLYRAVSQYVDQTHLKGRLVYFRVPTSPRKTTWTDSDERSLITKINIKPGTPYCRWLSQELNKRFDYTCCDSMEDFYRLPRAITPKGQVKTGGQRHEKDDRYSIYDRRRYVLGWQNKEKIKALEKIKAKYEYQGRDLMNILTALVKKQEYAGRMADNCRQFLKFTNYEEMLWQKTAQKIQALAVEKESIEKSSDILTTLKKQLEEVDLQISQQEQEKKAKTQNLGNAQGQLAERKNQFTEAKQETDELAREVKEILFPKIKIIVSDTLKETRVNLKNYSKCKRIVRDAIQDKIGGKQKRLNRLNEKIITRMQDFKNTFPEKTSEVDASIESLNDFNEMLDNLVTQDLPRHETKLKELLNTGTINSIALFQNRLDKKRREIEKKIETINISLKGVEYSPGTYIELLISPAKDSEIRDFQSDLRQCLSHTLDGKDIYNEKKFLEVKKILDRFNGREGYADIDRKWTTKVTDVRNWFVFSAAEKWQETGAEKEFYSDSSGKSGGQKEKLAYTILASALAYQFELEWGEQKSRTFRFVVIDEAFGRGSDESTRYGLELFDKLNLQLLIVTPLQKINIIEDYINTVHFVHNEEGKRSIIRNLSVHEYKEQKKKYLERKSA